jgi:hypothetical protein
MLYNACGDQDHLHQALALTAQVQQLVADASLTRQYEMAAACEASTTHLKLAELAVDGDERESHAHQALESSRSALSIYEHFGFVQVIECVSEELLYRHGLALGLNGRKAEAAEYRQRAYDEMMRKYDLIPSDSPFRHTFLEDIPLHREIRGAVVSSVEE